jgi:NTP pyrophosphatase (non-canonical NTP hydrolase)
MQHTINVLVSMCHAASKGAGWWNDIKTGEPLELTQERVGDKLMLIVTEIAEAKEGFRKTLMDDKLKHRSMIEVELADAVIRICDLAGALKLDLGGAIIEKMEYNAIRPDHKIENRLAEGGKKS